MSTTSKNTIVNEGREATIETPAVVATDPSHPTKMQRRNSKKSDAVVDDDGVVVVGNTENWTNHNFYTSILATNQEAKYEVLSREDINPNDIVLGRGGNDKGPYADTLKDWFPQYEAAKHSDKRIVCRDAIRDMYNRGVRFINRMTDGTRHGYFTIEPRGSARVERKVLRSLRQEVLNFNGQKYHTTTKDAAVPVPIAAPLPLIVQPESSTRPASKNTPKKVTPRKTKNKRKIESSISAPCRSQGPLMVVVPPPLVPPPSSDVVPPPAMGTGSSFGSVTGNKKESVLPLIPSAINFGTSDLAGQTPKKNDALTTKPNAATPSPDTVLTLDYLNYLNSSFGMGVIPKNEEILNSKSVVKPILKPNPSFDFKGIFDDTAVDNVMNEVEATICPPILTGRQSSVFSAVSFKEWNLNQKDEDSSPTSHVKLPSVVDPHSLGTFTNFSNEEATKHFDRHTIFDEGIMHVSPTAMHYNITNEVEHFVNDNTMPYVTPQKKGFDLVVPRNTSTPTRSNTKRSISNDFESPDTELYHELCHKLEDSMAKLEHEEMLHKNWESHNEGLWQHFIQEQPDLATILLSRGGDRRHTDPRDDESPVPTSTVWIPSRSNASQTGGSSVMSGNSLTFDSRNTSPVPWWFYQDHNMASDNNGNISVSMKWQQLIFGEMNN